MKQTSIAVLLFIGLVSCNYHTDKSVIETLPEEFQSLEVFSEKDYSLKRKVTNRDFDFSISLFKRPNDFEQILLIENSEGKMKGIPFMSNDFREYWAFEDNCDPCEVEKLNTTFNLELGKALKELKLDTNRTIASTVCYELFSSILHSETMTEKDSTDLLVLTWAESDKCLEENDQEVHERLLKNYSKMSSLWNPSEYVKSYNARFDRANRRIYQINYDKIKRGHDIKVFRTGQIHNGISI